MTPAQADAALSIANGILRQDRALGLNDIAFAFRGEGKEINRRVNRDLMDD